MTREKTIKCTMATMNRLYGLMEEALEFNEAHIEAMIKTVEEIICAANQHRVNLYAMQQEHIEFDEVLEYAEKKGA